MNLLRQDMLKAKRLASGRCQARMRATASRWCRTLTTAACMAWLAVPGQTRANGAWADVDCPGLPPPQTIPMPAMVTVPRDAPNGTLLGPWASVGSPNYWTCTVTKTPPMVSVGTMYRPLALIPTGMRIPDGSKDRWGRDVILTVFRTNVEGVGLAVKVSVRNLPAVDLGTPTNALNVPVPWVGAVWGQAGRVGDVLRLDGTAFAALVKTGPIATGGVVSGGAIAELALSEGVLTDKRVIIQTTATALAVQACSTPDVAVAMPKQKPSDFTGAGSVGATVGFSLRVNNCPANLNRVRYQFDAPNGVIDAAVGGIALTADSTARGVGIRITTDAGAALTFGSPGTLTAYSKTTGGSYSIPLKAAYYQTQSGAVTPGKANAALTVTMTYE